MNQDLTTYELFQDEQLFQHIVTNNLLKPVIDSFVSNGNNYNMLHSGVLDLLEYIRKVLVFCLDSS